MDTSEYVRFQRPGHRVTGDRTSQDRRHLDGTDIVHAIIDDHSGLAYAEIHPDQKAATVVGFLETRARLIRQPRHHPQAADVRQRLVVRTES